MNALLKAAAMVGVIATLGLAGAQPTLAKAHDQGVADGDRSPGESPATGNESDARGPGGVSGNVNDGQRGDSASEAGSDNSGDKGNGNNSD